MKPTIRTCIRRMVSALSSFFQGPPRAPIPDLSLELKRIIEQHVPAEKALWKGCFVGQCNFDDLKAAEAFRMEVRNKRIASPPNPNFDITKDVLCMYLVWRSPPTSPQDQPTAFRIESVNPYDPNCNETVVAMERVSDIDPSWYAKPTINIQV